MTGLHFAELANLDEAIVAGREVLSTHFGVNTYENAPFSSSTKVPDGVFPFGRRRSLKEGGQIADFTAFVPPLGRALFAELGSEPNYDREVTLGRPRRGEL